MGLSGSLEDISIVDVLQILGMSGKSGVLHIERVEQKIEIGFSKGMIVAANIRPRLNFLTDIVVDRGYVTSRQLQKALDQQKERRLPVGDILLESGEITTEKLEQAVMSSIQSVVNELAAWIDGEFSFELGETSTAADRLFLSDNVSLSVSLSPQELLMEAARIHDEAMAGKTEETRILPPAKAGPEEPEQEAPPDESEAKPDSGLDTTPPVLLLTSDGLIQNALKESLRLHHIMLHAARTFEEARHLLATLTASQPVLVVDTDAGMDDLEQGQRGLQAVLQQRRASGRVPIITFGSGKNPRLMAGILSAGVVSHLPRPVAAGKDTAVMDHFISSLARTVVREISRTEHEEESDLPESGQLGFAGSLYQAMLELRRSYHSVTISLDVLRFVADHLERAILFLVKNNKLIGLGGFGVQSTIAGDASKDLPRLQLAIPDNSPVRKVVDTMTVRRVLEACEDSLLDKLYEVIGRPIRSEALLIPIVVNDQVSSIIYADNGKQNLEVCSPEPLGILVEHAGLLLEIMLLRRRLDQKVGAQ